MVDDFHYYCFAVLVRAAGFTPEDALLMAYASQYTDDATEHKPIKVGGLLFDPVRTAHLGLSAYTWSIQKRVYIPFHFLPPKPIRSPEDTFVTAPGSDFAYAILAEAEREADPRFRLFRLAIALHTFADTFAHAGFSGRRHRENKVGAIYTWKGKKKGWKKARFHSIFLDFGPKVGHVSAGLYPDTPYRKFRYDRIFTREEIVRDNVKIYLKASKAIYEYLLGIDKPHTAKVIPWQEIKKKIKKLFKHKQKKIAKRCEKWIEEFSGWFEPEAYRYDRYTWREEALGSRNIPWEEVPPHLTFGMAEFPKRKGFYDSNWVLFHRAALKQRYYVLENLI